MGLKSQRLRVDGVVQPDTSDIAVLGANTKARVGRTLNITPTAGSGSLDPAVTYARLALPVNPGDTGLTLDRTGGLLSQLAEARILIGVGSRSHDFKAVTPGNVTGTAITGLTPLGKAHTAGDLVAILAPNEQVKSGWLGLGGGDGASADANTIALNRFASFGGLADLAGGSGVFFENGVYVSDQVTVRGDKCSLRGLFIRGAGLLLHPNFTFPSNHTKAGLAFQDASGNIATFANPNPAFKSPAYIDNMFVIGNNNSDGIGVMLVADGGHAHGFQVRYHRGPGAVCIGGRAFNVRNYQQDYCTYGFTSMGDGITLHDPCCTHDNPESLLLKAQVRAISGNGFEMIGGDLEVQSYPGVIVGIEGTATGAVIYGVWTSGLEGAGPNGTIINIDSTGVPGQGCAYDIAGFFSNNQNDTWKAIRDVQRNYSVPSIYGIASPPTPGLPNRTVRARTVSPTQAMVALGSVYSGVYGDFLCGQGFPQAAGNLGA